METSIKKRIWNKEELTIAYFIAKWGVDPLKMSEDELVEYVIGDTTKNSLKKHVANFRYLLNLDGYKLKDYSKAMSELVDELKNETYTNVKNSIEGYITENQDKISNLLVKSSNKKIDEKKHLLNKDLDDNFNRQLEAKRRFRRLRHVGTRKS